MCFLCIGIALFSQIHFLLYFKRVVNKVNPVITNWKNGSNRSYLKHLREIAEFYNVSESYLLGKTNIKNRPPELDDMADILSDPDIVMFARHTQKIPQADRKRILDNFRDTIDIYLTAIGIDPKEGDETDQNQ